MTGHGTFHWNELLTNDVMKAKEFFSNTLGWSFDEFPMLNGGMYWVAKSDEKPVGGIMSMEGILPDGTPPHWMSYIEVDDIDSRVNSISKAGGTLIREPFDVVKVGRIAILTDTTGAAIGWITPE